MATSKNLPWRLPGFRATRTVRMSAIQAVDAVVTWVDGTDPKHRAKRLAALNGVDAGDFSTLASGKEETRFADNGEIEFCIRSIRRHAPWIRHIHLVTDAQTPTFLTPDVCASLNVSIVDHREVFRGYEWVLPTFNSISIESVLWRIPNLSEHFIYFNDDVFLTQPTSIDDFFVGESIVMRGQWRRMEGTGPLRWALKRRINAARKALFNRNHSMHTWPQMRAAAMAGLETRYFKAFHTPFPMRSSTLRDYYTAHEDALKENIRHPFRNITQHTSTSLANHLEIFDNNAEIRDEEGCVMVCFNRDSAATVSRKLTALECGSVKFFCLQSFEQAPQQARDRALEILAHRVLAT